MTEGAQNRLGFSAIGGRKAKAEKIAGILAAAGCPLESAHDVLDLGCGSGEIAAHLANLARVTCSDAVDQRVLGRDLPFVAIGRDLPFADAAFDVVVSNHVVEHVGDATAHLDEIRRILRPAGVCYLATPNRWWPWEFHTRIPLLHYLPRHLFDRIGAAIGRLHEPLQLLSLRQLRRIAAPRFSIETWHPRVAAEPRRFALDVAPGTARLLELLPGWLFDASAALQPTLIVLLRPR